MSLSRLSQTLRRHVRFSSSSIPILAEGVFHSRAHDVTSGSSFPRFDPALGQKTSIIFVIQDGTGALNRVLALFDKHGVNLTRIESKPAKFGRGFEFDVDCDGGPDEPALAGLMRELRHSSVSWSLHGPSVVPWFPAKISDIDRFSTKTLDAGAELECDHPGFLDSEYRDRRRAIVEAALSYKHGTLIPNVCYTADETRTWGIVYERLQSCASRFAVAEYNRLMPLFEQNCGYSATNIPQLQDISDFLKSCTGFSLRPVGGLLSARDFLNALAFRVFFSTQYIRHHSRPLYTPEPDVIHELMGHVPMFANPDFADFSHEIGLASLGASDEEIRRLATCYWFSVEFGLCRQGNDLKAYGAGLLSSFGELEYACSPTRPAGGESSFPTYRPWEPAKAAVQPYPITTYQPLYYVADSLHSAKEEMRKYCDSLHKGFHVRYDPFTQAVTVDRAVVRGSYCVTLQK